MPQRVCVGILLPIQPWTYRTLVEVNFSVSEVGHLLEGVYRDKHGADICLARQLRTMQWFALPFEYFFPY